MVNLQRQYRRLQGEIDAAVADVLAHGQFVKGEEVSLFEEELAAFLDAPHVVSCGNGTDALQLALMALELQPGDEVITPCFTFFATAEVIALLGLTPVLVDVNVDDFTLDCDRLEAAITPRTKAIVPVHLFGQCANMQRVLEIAAKHGIAVVEDNAQAIGAVCQVEEAWVTAGTIGRVGATSFFPSKNLGCYGDGGALICRDEELARRLRALANHGMYRRYYHDAIGVNSRLDTLQAAILRVKLRHLGEFNRLRIDAADRYDALLEGARSFSLPKRSVWSSHVFHQYTIRFEHAQWRDRAKEELEKAGISSMVYYPLPLHRQKALQGRLGNPGERFPVAERLCSQVLSLPIDTEITVEEQGRVAEVLMRI